MLNTFKKYKTRLLIVFILILGMAACKSPRFLAPEAKMPVVNLDRVLKTLEDNQPPYQWMGTRFSGNVLFQGSNQNISGTLRIQKDKAIYVSIAPILGIEVARALITPDSVKIVNRLESTYYVGNISGLNHMFNTDVDFFMLQSLFMGDDFPHFRRDQFSLKQEGELLRLHAARRMRNGGMGNPINHSLMLEPAHLRIRANIITEEDTGRWLRADYNDWEKIEGRWIPSDFQIAFSDHLNNVSNLNLAFSRTTLNEPQRMQFSIPSRYTPVYLTD